MGSKNGLDGVKKWVRLRLQFIVLYFYTTPYSAGSEWRIDNTKFMNDLGIVVGDRIPSEE
jgi:hypothetical protein